MRIGDPGAEPPRPRVAPGQGPHRTGHRDQPTLTPTAWPSSSATPSPTPSPTPPASDLILYLHNNPTPPTGDTNSHDVLPIDDILPNAATLYNYDEDRDASPGLTILRGGSGPDEIDNAKHQHWQTPTFTEAVVIQGSAMVKLWSSMKDPDGAKGGAVTVYLRDCDGSNCVELGGATATAGGSTTWREETFTLPVGPHTVAAGHSSELKVIIEASSDDDMWFAYDTNNRKSRLTLSASAPTATLDVGLASSWLSRIWAHTLLRWRYS